MIQKLKEWAIMAHYIVVTAVHTILAGVENARVEIRTPNSLLDIYRSFFIVLLLFLDFYQVEYLLPAEFQRFENNKINRGVTLGWVHIDNR